MSERILTSLRVEGIHCMYVRALNVVIGCAHCPAGLEGAQFMLGNSIMMAPVLSEGAESVSVYFPVPDGGGPGDEEWVHWATGARCVLT